MSVGTRPATIGLFRSPAGIRNLSMDRYAEGLSAALRRRYVGAALIEEVRPGGRRGERAVTSPLTRRVADFGARFPSYLLHARSTRFAINHITDQAYGHLTYALDPRRTVVSCHDIFPLKHWQGAIRGLTRRVTPPVTVLASLAGMRRARTIVTSTLATKRDLLAGMGVGEARVQVVPYGLDPEFRPLPEDDRARARNHLCSGGADTRYILSVDTGAPYKNRRAVIEVLARVRARSGLDVRVLRVGPPLSASDLTLANSRGVAHATIELGSLSREDLVGAYNSCDALLFPSLYEGFGWPPLEAMACGLPVVASLSPAISEVVAGAALQADALDYGALASHVIEILRGDTPALVGLGHARARTFTWDRAANEMAALYAQILEKDLRASSRATRAKADTSCAV